MKVGFVSTFGLIRALSAEAIFRKYARLGLISAEVYSAGVEDCNQSPDILFEVLSEAGFSIEGLRAKSIKEIPYNELDILITLSPEARDNCPYLQNHKRREHWPLDEVSSQARDGIKRVVKNVETHVKTMLRIQL
ncbi:MAG: low molecular weight phosphatase family protein [Aquificaceae bacterium]|nr:low molecular weight phosphatase family protein [Aquificaceae bacterium]MDW8237561.1 low molecular weight phosphatase family protein [Aquificaceae bacterium]